MVKEEGVGDTRLPLKPGHLLVSTPALLTYTQQPNTPRPRLATTVLLDLGSVCETGESQRGPREQVLPWA